VTVLNDWEMPSVKGKSTEMVIGSSAIFKRGTVSQVIEAACGMYCYKKGIEACTMSGNEVLEHFTSEYSRKPKNLHESICARYEADVVL
jgi:hypothetical protein